MEYCTILVFYHQQISSHPNLKSQYPSTIIFFLTSRAAKFATTAISYPQNNVKFIALHMYLRIHKHKTPLTHPHTIIRNYNPHKHTYTHTHSQAHIKICIQFQWFLTVFSISSFHFIICLMDVVCKTLWNLKSQTNFFGIKYINLIYISIYYYYPIYQPLRSGRIWHKVNF